MAVRGFQQQPGSRRFDVENRAGLPEPIQEQLTPPPGCKGAAKKEFLRLVEQNRAAGVAIRQIDADIYAELAAATGEREEEVDPQRRLAWGRQINELRSQLNMGPRNRARAGVKDTRRATVAPSSTLGFIVRAKSAA